MTTSSKLGQLATYIEENLRASRTSGLTFVDLRHFKARLPSKQNHVIFGRRGAGKSTLVNSLSTTSDIVVIPLNLEDYKDITFPNIILQILSASLEKLSAVVKERHRWYWLNVPVVRFLQSLESERKILSMQMHEPDNEQQQIKTTSMSKDEIKASSKFGLVGLDSRVQTGSEREVVRTVPMDKLDYLRLELPNFKKLFQSASKMCGDQPIFLVFDDFYFVSKSTQPDLIDYFHRLTKDTNLFLKIATIQHRSRLYRRKPEEYVGVELGHDIFEIDMDYTLDNFEDLQLFMRELLDLANQSSNARLNIDDLFMGGGFSQLCLASGGVPRDFLSLFVRVANKVALPSSPPPIGKLLVNEEAIANLRSKLDSLKVDSGDEGATLEEYLSVIKSFVYGERRTNAFLIAKEDLEAHPQARQALRELIDLRLIHLVEQNTSSAPSDGRRYEGYILDIGLYDNTRPRNFTQIEPGITDDKSRKDDLRAAPRINLLDLEEKVSKSDIEYQLELSE